MKNKTEEKVKQVIKELKEKIGNSLKEDIKFDKVIEQVEGSEYFDQNSEESLEFYLNVLLQVKNATRIDSMALQARTLKTLCRIAAAAGLAQDIFEDKIKEAKIATLV